MQTILCLFKKCKILVSQKNYANKRNSGKKLYLHKIRVFKVNIT